MILCFRWYIRRQPETSHLKAGFSATTRIILSPTSVVGEHFSDKPNRASVVNVVSTGSLANDKGKHSRGKKKNLGKSWKQILVEHWTSHYFSLCLQMLLATVSSAKGQNKGACHRTTQPYPFHHHHHHHPPQPPQRSPSPFFSLFFFHFDAPPLSPATLCHLPSTRILLFLPLPLLLLDYFRFAFLSFSSPPSLRLSLSLFLCSSLNYWKQNGLKTKTQADVAWLITARRVWHPCQMKTVEKNYYCGRYVTPSPPAISLF